jgi:hypothetical protein
VWVGISSHGLLGPIFFEETVSSERYLSMLRNTFMPHLLATGLTLQTQWFITQVLITVYNATIYVNFNKGIHQHPTHITEWVAQLINTVKPQQRDRTKHNIKLIIIMTFVK